MELSDDSDIEVHPNVDKKSFIRAKQNQIHQQRAEKKHQIETLKYERIINNGLLDRIDRLLLALQANKKAAQETPDKTESLIFSAMMESQGAALEDAPPPAPAGVHQNVQQQPSYSQMMAALIDQVKKTVDESKPTDRYSAYITEVRSHQTKVQKLQGELEIKLAELETEGKGKITSEGLRFGFDKSGVSKEASAVQTELLNPSRPGFDNAGTSSGADADIEDETPGDDDEDADMTASETAKRFGRIKTGDYRASLQFISQNPAVLKPSETDGLLVEAFNGQSEGQADYARQCVHQALLLQYCRQLGKDGVQLFFKRVTTPGHQAQKLFLDDVNTTYARIRSRCKELAEQRDAEDPEGKGGVEQIQLQAVDPGTQIHIVVPPKESEAEEDKAARVVFETFPPGLQRALESQKLDKINEVLGKMSVDEAEEVVAKLGGSGMLSLEQGVIDTTTEEGKKQLEDMGRAGGEEAPQDEVASVDQLD